MSTLVDMRVAFSEERRSEPLYSIGEVAERLAVHPRTLMAYERLGLVRPVRRSTRRAYSGAEVRWLTCLRAFNRQGGVSLQGLSTLLQFVPCWAIRAELQATHEQGAVPADYPASDCLSRVVRAYAGEAPQECGGCENYRGGAQSGREALHELSRRRASGALPQTTNPIPGAATSARGRKA